jgi:hypothetical protein
MKATTGQHSRDASNTGDACRSSEVANYSRDTYNIRDFFFVYFFGGLECVGHSFAYVAHL